MWEKFVKRAIKKGTYKTNCHQKRLVHQINTKMKVDPLTRCLHTAPSIPSQLAKHHSSLHGQVNVCTTQKTSATFILLRAHTLNMDIKLVKSTTRVCLCAPLQTWWLLVLLQPKLMLSINQDKGNTTCSAPQSQCCRKKTHAKTDSNLAEIDLHLCPPNTM